MDFVRARTQEQIMQRQKDIISACDTLFEKGGYDYVNIKAISEMTAVTRSSIYTYYRTKDEIILDLLSCELIAWKDQLLDWAKKTAPLGKAAFCKEFTDILLQNEKMLQHYCLLYTFLEKNCSLERLVEFKQKVAPVIIGIVTVVLMNFPDFTQEEGATIGEEIMYYVLGLYPATHLTTKQLEALVRSNIGYHMQDFRTLCETGLASFLKIRL